MNIKLNIAAVFSLRDVRENNIPGLHRILVCIQGAVKGAYSISSPFTATQNTEQKTSRTGVLFFLTSLTVYPVLLQSLPPEAPENEASDNQ